MREENKIVHSLWVGSFLSRLELLTLHSFVAKGHEFHLWLYEPIVGPVPAGVVLRDASTLLPANRIFRREANDSSRDLGYRSFATFSDVFRILLLQKYGGIWVDMDVLCLRPFDFAEPYVFRTHRQGIVLNLMKCPAECPLLNSLCETALHDIHSDSAWFDLTSRVWEEIQERDLAGFLRADIMPEDRWESIQPYLERNEPLPMQYYGLHWMNSLWERLNATSGHYFNQRIAERIPDRQHPVPGSTLFQLYRHYKLLSPAWQITPEPIIPINSQRIDSGTASRSPEIAHLNLLVPSLNLGGAERCALDVAKQIADTQGTITIFVLNEVDQTHAFPKHRSIRYVSLAGQSHVSVLAVLTGELLSARNRRLFIFCVAVAPFGPLGQYGIELIPVVQNSFPGWHESPRALASRAAVPLIIACSDHVRNELVAAEVKKPVHTIRHQVAVDLPDLTEVQAARQRFRSALRVGPKTIVIGMIGQFKAQKAYRRAALIFREVRARVDARLIIVGDGGQVWGAGQECWADFQNCIQSNELAEDVFCMGAVISPGQLFHGFDVFLNTSYYEGLSISLLEAQQAGCPIVSAPAGGAREIAGEGTWIVEDADDPKSYVEPILMAASRKERILRDNRAAVQLIADLYTAIAEQCTVVSSPRPIAFILENRNLGGVQKSLLKLLQNSELLRGKSVLISLEAEVQVSFASDFERLSVPHLTVGSEGSVVRRASQLLQLCCRCGIRQIVFWNVPSDLKCVIAKIAPTDMQLVDVSPGPATYRELEGQEGFFRILAWDANSYFRRLDLFVSKYLGGDPVSNGYAPPRAVRVIRNGVAAGFSCLEKSQNDLPVLVTLTRIVPCKRLEGLLDMMDCLGQRRPEARLLIVGSAEPAHRLYAEMLADKVCRAGLANVEFISARKDPGEILSLAQIFVMFSEDQGCPNASLEAMAFGLPVVSNRSGGVTEQVLDGVTGYLAEDPPVMAARVEQILASAELRKRLGEAAQRHVAKNFSLNEMYLGYENSLMRLLDGSL